MAMAMAMEGGVSILPWIVVVSVSTLWLVVNGSNSTTIYEELRAQGLPVGLLPKGITRYSINGSSGEFEVWMEQPCNAKFENEVHYDSNIKGTLGYGRIGELSGVTAQELFLWFPVKGIRVDLPSSGLIHFDVGVADKQFSLSLFEDPPDCNPQDNADGGGDVLRAVW
ncbi:uncharacterized protein LOC133296266 [Gastrolobium bilobum]|uniref:uncharacterized protein LOC133296266 n=1 Tax=Gastrolobium bilobum TaxID=150636 RepID=UPI002AB2A20B|nr:uncharacterized protein LOC133296266 [Gastrolobium bilobum]